MGFYLCYDVRGIQAFLFAVPRLRYIIGGSALIDGFDRDTVPALAERSPGTLLYAGGGRGALHVPDESVADAIERELVREAHAIGLDLRIGRHASFSEAAHSADRLFPYLPDGDELDGHPCKESGLLPVRAGLSNGVHPIIRKREVNRDERMGRRFEERIRTRLDPAQFGAENFDFFRDVDPNSEEDGLGAIALGNRNRWAIVCMDGNDIGAHFRAKSLETGGGEGDPAWIAAFSRALDKCTIDACARGIEAAVQRWLVDSPDDAKSCVRNGRITLPIRPLVVGGDDIAVIVHARHAFDFVEAVCAEFSERSRELASSSTYKEGLWPATAGGLTISAGILFCPVTLPLASAIPYTESLLAQAKAAGRRSAASSEPSPATVDWESVTESMIDHPATRRQRELVFLDGDLGGERIELTRRPYRLDRLAELRARAATSYQDIPGSILHQVLPSMRAGANDRMVFLARMARRHRDLVNDLTERTNWPDDLQRSGRWWRERKGEGFVRSTDVLDALSLLRESSRMSWETA